MSILRAVKGMNDLFADELVFWQKVEKTTAEVFSTYGFAEVRTPILEDLALFVRSVGETTDIVEKEMYMLEDRDGKKLCLRPENTAGVVRALIENGKFGSESEIKNYYLGPMFRRERPQRGRLRQFYQIGAESFGISEASVDVELIAMFHDLLKALGILDLRLLLNTLGLPGERAGYVAALYDYFSAHTNELCADCQRRLQKNTLRVLDCKQPGCSTLAQQAPPIGQFLTDASQKHFDQVQEGLTKLAIPYEISPKLVRGLDYYTRTVFEIVAESGLGSQNAVGGGGRYDGLVKNLGGPDVPAFGFAAGIERIVLLLKELQVELPLQRPDITLVYADDTGKAGALELLYALRNLRVKADIDHKARSLKAQMRRADRLGAKSVTVLGEKEIREQSASIKWLNSGDISPVRLSPTAIEQVLKGLT